MTRKGAEFEIDEHRADGIHLTETRLDLYILPPQHFAYIFFQHKGFSQQQQLENHRVNENAEKKVF